MIGLIFSRDRAMQLGGVLRSFFLHCEDPDKIRLFVIFKTTNDIHRKQYAQLAREYADIRFIKEKKFRYDVLRLLMSYKDNGLRLLFQRFIITLEARFGFYDKVRLNFDQQDHILFLVDDNIFVRDFGLGKICKSLDSQPKALGFSLRLGDHINYQYTSAEPQLLPAVTYLTNSMMIFDWTTAMGYFGYPLEVSSSVYRQSELLPLLRRLPFDNPNTLEGNMAAHSQIFRENRPQLLCYDKSVTFCNPVNMVQNIYTNPSGEKTEYSSENLAQMFDAGYRINVESYSNFLPASCHQEVELIYERQR